MHCPACGVETLDQATFCHQCGKRLSARGEKNGAAPSTASGASATGGVEGFRQSVSAVNNAQNPPEEELWRGGYSSKAMLGAWAISASISVVLLLVGFFWMPWTAFYWLIVLVAALAPWIYNISVLCYRRMSVSYVLSNQRFIHEKGIIRHVNNRIELLDVDDISFEQGLLERLVGVGTIRIASHDRSDPELVLPGIENVKELSAIFDNARLAERRRRGLHVEQI
jgi:membrane protein YdbS with pleckstrin-like domain